MLSSFAGMTALSINPIFPGLQAINNALVSLGVAIDQSQSPADYQISR
ncbi:hypothetical protein [Nodularia sp. UHCC 0506]|nr:hypothetical protein [Nodularia sp. UHCC 0506]MEA5514481.1 hypothetical protein [Nodularia sp. UHCC 0506]